MSRALVPAAVEIWRTTRLVVRSFDRGHGVAAKDRQLADESPLLAVLFTPGDEPPEARRHIDEIVS